MADTEAPSAERSPAEIEAGKARQRRQARVTGAGEDAVGGADVSRLNL